MIRASLTASTVGMILSLAMNKAFLKGKTAKRGDEP
jgi:hypothetical protein